MHVFVNFGGRRRPGMVAVTLDSYTVSKTPFKVLAQRYDGVWDRRHFAEEHILFPERNAEYDYLAEIIWELIRNN